MWWNSSPERRFRRAKYADYFARLDRNDNGVLEREDFATYVAAIADALSAAGSTPTDEALDRLRTATTTFWTMLVATLDVDGDQAIDLGELVGAFSQAAIDAEHNGVVPPWAAEHAVATFRVLDVDGDGAIDHAEYDAYLSAIRSPADSAAAFALLDVNGDGAIQLADVEKRYREWLESGDRDAPGNVLLTGQLPE